MERRGVVPGDATLLYAACGLSLAIGFLIGHIGIDGVDQTAEQYGQQGWEVGMSLKDWIDVALTMVLAIATWGIWRVSIGQKRLLERSANTAENVANNMVALERGQLNLVTAVVNEGSKRVECTIKNIGRSTCVLEVFAVSVRPLGGRDMSGNPQPTRDITPRTFWHVQVDPGKTIDRRGDIGDIIPDTCYRPDGSIKPLMIEFELRYKTMSRHVLYHCAWWHVPRVGGVRPPYPGLEYDVEVPQ